MFNLNDLDALAKMAKEELKKQEDIENETNDIYAEFRNDENLSVNSDTEENEKMLKTLPSYEDIIELPKLHNEPSEDYYEQEYPEIMSYDEELFPGGPTKTQLDSWKKQWKGYDIYATEVAGEYFVFRTINRFEYKQLVALQNTDPLQREEIICETCVLWPGDYRWDTMATQKAGIPSVLAQIIMEKSGFTKEYAIQVL